jgi:hypothetical protein
LINFQKCKKIKDSLSYLKKKKKVRKQRGTRIEKEKSRREVSDSISLLTSLERNQTEEKRAP